MAFGFSAALRRAFERDLAELLARRAELVEVAHRHHPDPVGRGRRPVREPPLHEAAHAHAPASAFSPSLTPSPAERHRRAALVALRRRLGHRAEADDVVRQPRGHRQGGVDHRAELARRFESPCEPVEVEPQRVLQLGHAGPREPRRDVHVPRVGRHAVDVVAGQAGVVDGPQHGLDGERQRVAVDAPSDLRLADARDGRGPLPHDSHGATSGSGSNMGSHTSS